MKINKWFKTAEKKYAFGIYGILISLFSLGAGYYWAVREQEPQLIYDVFSNTQVFSINANVNKLQVVYNNEDLRSKNKKLTLLTIRIENIGNANIKETDYYSGSAFGFKLINAELAEPPTLIDASNEFLFDNIRLRSDSINKILINKIPLDKSQSFTIKLLAIVKGNAIPGISPFGYISGTNGNIKVIESYKSSAKEAPPITTLDKLFKTLGIVFLVIVILIILKVLYDRFFGRKESDLNINIRPYVIDDVNKNLEQNNNLYQKEIFDIVLELYKDFGKTYLQNLRYNYFENYNFLEKVISCIENGEPIDYLFNFQGGNRVKLIVTNIINQNLVRKSDNGIEINLTFSQRLLGLFVTIREFEYKYY